MGPSPHTTPERQNRGQCRRALPVLEIHGKAGFYRVSGGDPTSAKLRRESREGEAPGINIGAEERTRTSTTLRPQAPEACASANSATSA